MPLYPFQRKVYELVSAGRSVILQAPTGAGKTRAALYPFLHAWEYKTDFPRKGIYSVPLRVLANQFHVEYEARSINFGFTRPLAVTIQTGERPDDPKLEGNLIFTTVDQTLSNVLNIPYALSLTQANLNAGAVLSSYLVFDEIHLFPNNMLATTLHVLRWLQGIVPFTVMTATLSKAMVQGLAQALQAELVVVDPQEATSIPSQAKTRRIHRVDALLSAESVLAHHRRRSIAICNTVDRAQALFRALRDAAPPDVEVRLLHSRFLPEDRAELERWAQDTFGCHPGADAPSSAILVATQVVEVGLDITCESMHTETAPAASLVQRAGRCARYAGQEGDVYVYALPLDKRGKPNTAPYFELDAELCHRTWEALSDFTGGTMDYSAELALVDAVHGEPDQKLLEALQVQRHAFQQRIEQTIAHQERGNAATLIRKVESRTVIVHPQPETLDNPWRYAGFGLHVSTLRGAYEKLIALREQTGAPWAMMTAQPAPEGESARAETKWIWHPVNDAQALTSALLVAVHPSLARYDPALGFQLGEPGEPTWQSPRRTVQAQPRAAYAYQRETLSQHIDRMLAVLEHEWYDPQADTMRLPLAEEMAYAADRLASRYDWPADSLSRLARIAIILHDLGKLDRHWQRWAYVWQQELASIVGEQAGLPPDNLLAHTDYNPADPRQVRLNAQLERQRPPHAAEGAAAAQKAILDAAKSQQALARALLTALVRHHSAATRGHHDSFRAVPGAESVLAPYLPPKLVAGIRWQVDGGTLSKYLVRSSKSEELLPYLLLVRVLRLADQRSQIR